MPQNQQRLQRRIKRALDVAVAGGSLLLLAPLFAGVALSVRVGLGGPVLFRQKRPGLRGRPFTLYKFRTMKPESESLSGPESDAARLTALGRFLRRASLDELPSLWNVLIGDMSLVGPRPLLMEYLELYSPEQARRHDVPPGVTGLAQVEGRNALEWDEKFRLDTQYVDSWNLALDLRILAKTVKSVLKREGISAPGSATMPKFRGSKSA